MPPSPTEPNNSYVSCLGVVCSGAAGPLTVMTGPGAENWCTFHMHTAPTATTMTATNGIQTRAKTVLPTERGLTRSPFGTLVPDLVSSPRATPPKTHRPI